MPKFRVVDPQRTMDSGLCKRSNFLITVNTNRSGPAYHKAMGNLRKPFLELMESSGAFLEKKDGSKWRQVTSSEWEDEEQFISCDVSYGVEVAPTNKSVHSHIGVKVTHRSFVRISFPAVHAFFVNGINACYAHAKITSLYINIKPMYADSNLDDYVNKQMNNDLRTLAL